MPMWLAMWLDFSRLLKDTGIACPVRRDYSVLIQSTDLKE
jgi:hypothetical protein